MSEPWAEVADQLKDVLIDEGKEFVKDAGDEYKEIMGQIALDFAKQKWLAKRADTPEERQEAEENLEFLQNTVEDKLMQSQLDLVDRGASMIGKIVKVAMKVLPLVLI